MEISGCYTTAVARDWQPSAPRFDSRAAENPLHGADHFIAEGRKYADEANRQLWRACWFLVGALALVYVAHRFGL